MKVMNTSRILSQGSKCTWKLSDKYGPMRPQVKFCHSFQTNIFQIALANFCWLDVGAKLTHLIDAPYILPKPQS